MTSEPWIRLFVLYARHVRCHSQGWGRWILGLGLRSMGRLMPGPPAYDDPALPAHDDFDAGKFPRIVWMYWADGEAAAPELVRRCIRSWREVNPGWEVRVLDDSTVRTFAKLEFPPADTRIQLIADVLRLELLYCHGGVWADATCLCTRPLDEWLTARMGSGFFAFHRPGRDRLLANWFLASVPNGALISAWLRSAQAYWCGEIRSNHIGPNGRLDQFIHHYLFEWLVRTDARFWELWRQTPTLPAGPPHYLQAWLADPEGTASRRSLAVSALMDPDVPVHKLTWRIENGSDRLQEILGEAPHTAPSN